MPTVAPRRPPSRVPADLAALAPHQAGRPVWGPRFLRRSTLQDAERLPPARRLRAASPDVPAQSRIVLRHGTAARR
jgi:hypothetical protein